MVTGSPHDIAAVKPGKILVTGGDGQLGMQLREIAGRFPQYEFHFFSRQQLPIDETSSILDCFKKIRPQYCINCAAYTQVDKAESEKETAFHINADAVNYVASACKDYNTTLIHISTDYVFDGAATSPYVETSPVDPVNMYGATKLAGERHALNNNPATIVIRTSWVYSEHGKNFVKTMMRLMNEKQEVNVVNDQFGSPTYAADLAESLLQIITDLPSNDSRIWSHAGIYHFCNAGVVTWYDFAVAIKEITGSNCKINPISTAQFPTAAKRPSYSVLDTNKIQNTFGIAMKPWMESLRICLGKLSASKSA